MVEFKSCSFKKWLQRENAFKPHTFAELTRLIGRLEAQKCLTRQSLASSIHGALMSLTSVETKQFAECVARQWTYMAYYGI